MNSFRNKIVATFLICQLWLSSASAVTGELKVVKQIEEAEKTTTAQPDYYTRPNIQYESDNLRDPFQKPIVKGKIVVEEPKDSEAAPQNLPSLTVQGVIWGGRFPLAIINNKVVKIGDTIEETKVIGIDKERITLLFQDRIFTLPSPASSFDKKP